MMSNKNLPYYRASRHRILLADFDWASISFMRGSPYASKAYQTVQASFTGRARALLVILPSVDIVGIMVALNCFGIFVYREP